MQRPAQECGESSRSPTKQLRAAFSLSHGDSTTMQNRASRIPGSSPSISSEPSVRPHLPVLHLRPVLLLLRLRPSQLRLGLLRLDRRQLRQRRVAAEDAVRPALIVIGVKGGIEHRSDVAARHADEAVALRKARQRTLR